MTKESLTGKINVELFWQIYPDPNHHSTKGDGMLLGDVFGGMTRCC